MRVCVRARVRVKEGEDRVSLHTYTGIYVRMESGRGKVSHMSWWICTCLCVFGVYLYDRMVYMIYSLLSNTRKYWYKTTPYIREYEP